MSPGVSGRLTLCSNHSRGANFKNKTKLITRRNLQTRAQMLILKSSIKKSWEVDALNPEVLVQIVQQNIEENIDMDIFHKQLEREDKDRKTLEEFIKNSKK